MLARSMCFTARPGRADDLAALLMRVADGLRAAPGCLYWLVARSASAPDEVWVQELWASESAAEQALATQDSGAGPSPAEVMELCSKPPQRTDLQPVGGVGFVA